VIPSLSPILFGEMKHFAHTLVLSDDTRPAIPGPALLESSTMDELLTRAAAHLGEGDIRARMSLWSIDYVHALMPLAVVGRLVLNRELPIALDDIALILDDEAMPTAIRLRDEGTFNRKRDPYLMFGPMIDGNLRPLFDAWAAHAGIASRVLWTNAANLFEAILREIEKLPLLGRRLTVNANRLLTDSHWPDGSRNPFRNPVLYRSEHPTNPRWRRVCCVRYLIPRYDYCSNCPHLLAMTRGTL
jgi:ferric iron reductase protein FhuF